MQTRTGMGAWIGSLLLLTAGHNAWAANATWIGATDGTWATDTNWSVPPAPGTGNTATFNNAGNGNTTLDLGGGVTVKTVLFDTTNAAAYTIGSSGAGSQTITLNDLGAITINSTVTNNQGVDANLTLGTATASSYTLTSGSAGRTLTLAGKVQGGTGGTAAAKTLSVAGAGNTTISGVITNGGASSLALSKTGSGTLVLSAINTYTGNTTAGGGVLRADYGTGLPSATGVLYLNGSGVLETSGTITRNLGTGAGNIAFSGSGGFAARGSALGVTLNSGATLTAGSTGSFMGQGASLVLGSSSADSVLTLNNSLDYAANPGSTWGGLNVIHNTSLPLTQDKAVLNGGLRFTGGNAGSSNGWQKYGNGRLEITGAGASGGVNVLVSEGVLALTGSGDLSTYRGVWSSGGGFEIAGGAANTAKTIQILGLSSGTDMPGTVVSTAYGGPGTFTLIPGAGVGLRLTAASVSRGAGAVVLFRGPGLGTASYPSADLANLVVTTTSGLALTGGGGGAGSTTINIVPYAIGDNSATGSGSDFVTHTANGIRLLSAGASEYKTTIDDGQTALDNVNLTGAQTLSVPTTINALRLDNGGSVGGAGGSLTINSGATLALAGNGGLSVGTLAYGAKEAVFTTLGDLAVSSALTGSGGLAKSGSGTMTLSGAYGITGTAVVSAGALVAGAVNALPSTLKLSPGALVDAAGYNQVVAALTGHALGIYTNSGAAITLTVNAPAGTTMGPTFWGAMDIVKTGAGTYGASPSQLSNTGALTVNAGTFQVNFTANNGTLGKTITLDGGGLLFFSQLSNNNSGIEHLFGDNITIGSGGGTITLDTVTGFNPINGGRLTGTVTMNGPLVLSNGAVNKGVGMQWAVNNLVVNGTQTLSNNSPATAPYTATLPASINSPAANLTMDSSTGAGFLITGASGTSLNLQSLTIAAGGMLTMQSGTGPDPFGKIKANGGITTVYGRLGLRDDAQTIDVVNYSFQPGSQMHLLNAGWNSSWTVTDNLTVDSTGLTTLHYEPFRGGLTVSSGKTLTIGNGGLFSISVARNDGMEYTSANIRLLDGAVLQGAQSVAGGLIRSGGTLTLGDGTASTVTIRGNHGTGTHTFNLGYAANTSDGGNFKVKYANTVTGAANYFNVGWSNGGNTLAALLALKETSGGTEFAPLAGSSGVAVVGPSGTAKVATFAKSVTHTTAGTVGFHNAGASNVRGALGAVELGATSALSFQTNGTLRAGDVTFKSGAALNVRLTGASPTACSLVDASGTLTFEANTSITITEEPGLAGYKGPWYVAKGATLSGLPKKSAGLYSVTAEAGYVRIDRLPTGTVLLMR